MEREREKKRKKEEQKKYLKDFETPDPFIEPSEDESLWRYMSFAKLMDLLDKGLFFAKASLFNDPAEGQIPPKNVQDLLEIGNKINKNYNPVWKGNIVHGSTPPFHSGVDTDVVSRNTLCSCWYLQPNQSVSMWDRYGSEGIAIKTTVKRIKEGIKGFGEHFRIGKVCYIDYSDSVDFKLNIRWENNQPYYDSNFNYRRFLHKQREYEDENEVRLIVLAEYLKDVLLYYLKRSEAQNIPLSINNDKWKNTWGSMEIPVSGIHLPIDPEILIESVFVSNKAEPFVKRLIEKEFRNMNLLCKPKIEESKLLQRQYIWT